MDSGKELTKAVYLIPLWLMYGEIAAAWKDGFELPVKSGSCLLLLVFFTVLYSAFHAFSPLWEKAGIVGDVLAAAAVFSMLFFQEVREQLMQLLASVNSQCNRAYGMEIMITSLRHTRTDCTIGFFWLFFLFFGITLYLFWKEVPLIWQVLPGVVLFLVPVMADGQISSTVSIGFFCGMLLFLTRVGQRGKNVIPAFGVGAAMLILSAILVSLFFPEWRYESLSQNDSFSKFVSEQTEILEEVVEGGSILQGEFDPDGKIEYGDITMYRLTVAARAGNTSYVYLKSFEGTRYHKGRWLGESSKNNIAYTGTISHINSNTWKIERVAGKEDIIPYGVEGYYNVEKGAIAWRGGTWESYQSLVCQMERHWADYLSRPIVKTDDFQKEREIPDFLRKVCKKRMQSIHADACHTYKELADAVRNMFISDFKYSQEPGKPGKNKDELLYFLKDSHTGYCVHFSSAAVHLFRSLGIPARYVQGYTVDTTKLRLNRPYNIKDYMSHAWVEINIDGLWVPVDLTPGRSEDYFNDDGNSVFGEDSATGAGIGSLSPSAISSQAADGNFSDHAPLWLNWIVTVLLYRIGQLIAVVVILLLVFLFAKFLLMLWNRRKMLQLRKKGEWELFLRKLHGEFLRYLASKKVRWDEYSREETHKNIYYAFSPDIPFVYESDMLEFEAETKWYVNKMFALRYGEAEVTQDEVLRAVRWYKKIIRNRRHFVFGKVFKVLDN